MQRHIKRGASADTGLIFHVFAQDSASTTGAGKASIAFGSWTCRYIRSGEAISAAITPEDITTIGTYAAPTASTNIRIKAVDNTNMIGVYEVQIHADWVNTTNNCQSLTVYLTATGVATLPIQIPLIVPDLQAALATPTNITAGTITTTTTLTNLPAITANWLTAAGIAADAITAAKIADGAIDAATFAAGAINAAAIAADAITDAKVAADVTIASVTGAVGSVTGAVGSVTGLTAATVHADLDDIQARLPAALTAAGNMKADVLRLNGDAAAAATLAILNGANVVYSGTVTGAATTTTLIDSGLTQADADWWKGRIIIFTSVITGQATDITAFTPATDTLTFTATTAAPTGATFVII